MTVTLEPDEILICEQLGRLRSLIARSAGVVDAKIGKQDGSEADVMGIKAEYAFAKRFNTFPDLGLVPRSGSPDGIIKGYAYDIKSTAHQMGRLLASRKVNPDVEIYVLCIVERHQVEIKGYATKDELILGRNLRDLGHGEGYCLEQDALHKFREIQPIERNFD